MIYLDNHATTPVDPRVLAAMMPYFTKKFGNAASRTHAFGKDSEKAVQKARGQVARLVNARPHEIVFTSGATESDNLAMKGVAEAYREKGNHVLTVATEHKAVLDSCKRLQMAGFRVTYLPVRGDGVLDIGRLQKAIGPKTVLISVMFANNEIGVIQPVAEIGRMARERGIVFHCDAVQAVGKIPVDVKAMNVDLMAISAHKMYGPKGVGALFIRKSQPRTRLFPLIDGGGHEGGFRSGTLNVPGIVGFGRACELCRLEMGRESRRLAKLRDKLREGLLKGLPDCRVNGSQTQRLPNNLNISFAGVRSEALMNRLGNIAVSSGSACTSTSVEPSYVLKALGVSEELRRSSLRFGLGRFNTPGEIDRTIADVTRAVRQLRKKKAGKTGNRL